MTGDFGYLVAGQEPVNFDAAVQALTGAAEKEKGKYYRELYPWDILPNGLKKKDLTQVKLITPEAIYVDYMEKGKPTAEVPSKARFKADVKSFKVASGGAFEQKITSLTAVKDLKVET